MLEERGLKRRCLRGYEPSTCAVLVTSAWRKPISSTLGLPQLSIWFGSPLGFGENFLPQRGFLLLSDSSWLFKGFTSSVLFGEPSKESCEMEQFLAKKGETGSAIHEPLVRFNFVHRPFDWPLAPREGQSCSYCIIIPFNASDKTAKFFDAAFTGLLHPSIEPFWLSLAQHLKKRLEQIIEFLYLLRALQDPLLVSREANGALVATL